MSGFIYLATTLIVGAVSAAICQKTRSDLLIAAIFAIGWPLFLGLAAVAAGTFIAGYPIYWVTCLVIGTRPTLPKEVWADIIRMLWSDSPEATVAGGHQPKGGPAPRNPSAAVTAGRAA